MIILHRFKELVQSNEPRSAGTSTCTRTRTESSDQDAFLMARTKSVTAVKAEAPDTDFSADSGRAFPIQSDLDSDQQG